ncbi:large ribosomal subunit protein mL40 [Takifugu rubripes]|uniref:Large ribosomal subunit protein mL40 n=1 Tax=Takifugu rubripes TaxID=31033 RepID=A0A3B5JY34_TAKRU|nr:39S ribosomal protein L40, mitochondrial [Takifugu rubripes]XP_056889470.1 39S ribosomal protein L40, mitochondrial [Takifugu flavidus]|eukprot:XP_003975056.1 PREDICTED: 39S ribosomal protein L40, mitochondrial [Takifugu rubripes]
MALSRCLSCFSTRQTASSIFLFGEHHHAARSLWFAPVMTIKTSAALRAEPKKKKKVDPRREQIAKDRLKKKLKKLEKVAPELIPIEDFLTPTKFLDETRERTVPKLSFEESERRALLLKDWSRYKQEQHMAEVQAVENALEAQREALEELKLESEELYRAALKPDLSLFPFTHEGPVYTPPNPKYEAPDGKYNDITRVYTQ